MSLLTLTGHTPAWKRVFCAFILGFGLAARAEMQNPDAVMSVAGEPVSREEFIWFMQQERAEVAARFPNQQPAVGGNFWTHRAGFTTPRKILLEQTTTRLRHEKAEQILFKRLGLVEDIRFAQLQANLEQFNRERAEAQARGRVIYGPVQFTLLQFYGHRKAELQIEAKKKLGDGPLAPTAKTLDRYYRKHSQPFTTPEQITLEISFPQATNTPPARYEALTPDRLGELFPDLQTFSKVEKLKPGGSLQIAGGGQAEIVKCISKTPERLRPLEEVQEAVRERCLNESYTQYVDQLAHDSALKINRAALDSITVN